MKPFSTYSLASQLQPKREQHFVIVRTTPFTAATVTAIGMKRNSMENDGEQFHSSQLLLLIFTSIQCDFSHSSVCEHYEPTTSNYAFHSDAKVFLPST
jgi:hypothetical protein